MFYVFPANFKRPIVILGPLNDIAMEKLAREMPDEFQVAGKLFFSITVTVTHLGALEDLPFHSLFSAPDMVPRSGAERTSSTVIKLDTVRKIAEQVRN